MDESHNTMPAIAALATSGRSYKKLRHQLVQMLVVCAVFSLVVMLALAIKNGLAQHGMKFSFSFLFDSAGFDISEGKTLVFDGRPGLENFSSEKLVAQAFITGIFNTLKISVLAIVFSTILGTLLGVGRLSTNWIVRSASFGVVEFVRNTPLLIQLVFWYFAVILNFPPIAGAVKFYGSIISQQGIFFPTIDLKGNSDIAAIVLVPLAALIVGVMLIPSWWVRILSVVLCAIIIGTLAFKGTIEVSFPTATKFAVSGGTGISPEMAALLLAIVVNSAAYIAEIVRGAIDTLPRGQWEAAASLALSRKSTINDIILPQVFRVVLPSFGNQYISLTKNTALGIAVGYPELFNLYGTIANQTGHSLEGIVIVMISYLILSWTISAAVGVIDRHLGKEVNR